MKKTCLFLSVMLCFVVVAMAQSGSVGIGTTTPNASAAIDIQSTDKGILIPRMTTVQRNAISNPATGLLVFDNSTGSFWFSNSGNWVELVDTLNSVWKRNGNHIHAGVSGNIGIGTSSPSYNLHIDRANASLGFTDTDDNTFSGSITADSTDLVMISARAILGGTPGNLLLQTSSGLAVGGRVGIGTSNPTTKLDVGGSIRFNGKLNSSLTGTANLAPIAYGRIDADGTIISGTGNFSVSFTDTPEPKYTITVPSVPANGEAIIFVSSAIVRNISGNILAMWANAEKKAGTSDFDAYFWSWFGSPSRISTEFSFVIYAP